MDQARANEVFSELKALLEPFQDRLVLVHDEPRRYYLDTAHIMPNGQSLYFGSVAIGKRYVSYHLMPVYVEPALLADMTVGLRKRMQGKSCFNFTKPDAGLFAELAALTRSGFAMYQSRGYV